MNLRGTGWDGMGWIHLAQDGRPVEIYFEHGNEPSGSKKMLGIS
jgi:hypothetical protein